MSKLILTKTPLRISFAGGGTDIDNAICSMKEPGMVINIAINKYVYITLKKHSDIFKEKYRLNYSENELVNQRSEIKNKLIKETLNYMNIDENLYISSISDIPAGSGLGSSSAFTIGLLNAIHCYKGDRNISQNQLAQEAIEIESKRLDKSVGSQDQYGCALGGLKFLRINRNNKVDILRREKNYKKLNFITDKIILVWTEKTRSASKILQEQSKNNSKNKQVLLDLKRDAIIANKHCISEDLNALAKLINESWKKKKALGNISNKEIDNLIDDLHENGINGCKLLGAGGGGFIMGFNFKNKDNLSKKLLRKIINIKPDIDGSVVLLNQDI